MYEFVRGPLVWLSFILFIGGSLYRLISMFTMARKDKVVYPYMSLKHGLFSIFHWIIPFASTNMRRHPEITIITFAFHICLIFIPIFLLAHNILLFESWKISFWTLPDRVADIMTLIVIFCCIFLLIRRIITPEVKFVTFISDYILLAVVFAPFITGFFACHQLFFPYKIILIIHILCGEIMLIVIPFTRLSHMLFFFFTRGYMGSEFGAVRNSKDW